MVHALQFAQKDKRPALMICVGWELGALREGWGLVLKLRDIFDPCECDTCLKNKTESSGEKMREGRHSDRLFIVWFPGNETLPDSSLSSSRVCHSDGQRDGKRRGERGREGKERKGEERSGEEGRQESVVATN